MKMNMQQWKKNVLNADQVFGLPIVSYPGLAITGGDIHAVVTDAQAQFQVMLGLHNRFPLPAVLNAIDLTVEAEAFGCQVSLGKNDLPKLTGEISADRENILALPVPPLTAGRIGVFIKAVEMAAANIHDLPVLPVVAGPFTVASSLIGLKKMSKLLLKDKDLAHALLAKAFLFCLAYARAFQLAGANGLIIEDLNAGLLSPGQCAEFSSAYIKKLVDTLQNHEFAVVLHNCGNTGHLVETMVSTGCAGYSFGNAVDMAVIMPRIPADALVFGNIDPTRFVGSPQEMATQVRGLLEKMRPYRNFVLASGCDVPLETPLENIDQFYQTLAEFNREENSAGE